MSDTVATFDIVPNEPPAVAVQNVFELASDYRIQPGN